MWKAHLNTQWGYVLWNTVLRFTDLKERLHTRDKFEDFKFNVLSASTVRLRQSNVVYTQNTNDFLVHNL